LVPAARVVAMLVNPTSDMASGSTHSHFTEASYYAACCASRSISRCTSCR
jgi:hypothetical protein